MNVPLRFDAFENPGVLYFLLPALLFAVFVGLLARRRVRMWALLLSIVARAAALVIVLFGLAGPASLEEQAAARRYEFIVDLSRSVDSAQRMLACEDIERRIAALRGADPEARVAVFGFAGTARILVESTAAEFPVGGELTRLCVTEVGPELEPLESRIAPVLALADAGRRGDEDAVQRIYSDFALEAPGAHSAGRVHRYLDPLSGPEIVDVAVRALQIPSRIEAKTPLDLVVECTSTRSTKAELTVSMDGVERKRVPVELEAGRTETRFDGRDVILEPGHHDIVVRVSANDREPLDDARAAGVFVQAPRYVLHVRGGEGRDEEPAIARALRAQGVDVRSIGAADLDAALILGREISAVLLDGVPPEGIDGSTASTIESLVREGAGLFLLPRQTEGELERWNGHPLAAILPLEGLPTPPPITPPDQPRDDEKPPESKLEDPDPEDSRTEKVDAPTLAMLIMIDKSSSMKENNHLRQAQLGAIATARELHPDDHIGVLAFNEDPVEVVPIQSAGNKEEIESAIQRLQAEGGTDIESALTFAREMLAREDAAVKTIVLLSDGFTRPFPIRRLMATLTEVGISVNTIGIGSNFDVATLTQIAVDGRGTGPIPARSPQEIPRVMVDVASLVMNKNKTRTAKDKKSPKPPRDPEIKRPENLLDGPESAAKERRDEKTATSTEENSVRGFEMHVGRRVAYLDTIDWVTSPRIADLHRSKAKRDVWVTLETDEHRPILAHVQIGDGLCAMTTMPSEDGWSKDLELWNGYAVFMAQVVRFLEKSPHVVPVEMKATAGRDRIGLTIDDARTRGGEAVGDVPRFVVKDEHGSTVEHRAVKLGDGRYELILERASESTYLRTTLMEGEDAVTSATAAVEPPEEIVHRGLDVRTMGLWAAATGATIVTSEIVAAEPARTMHRSLHAVRPESWIIILAAILLVDIAARRIGRRTET